MSDNLSKSVVAAGQNNAHTTINDIAGELDAAITHNISVLVDNTNAASITAANLADAFFFTLDDDSPAPTAAITITVASAVQRGAFAVYNNTSYAATITISGQTLTAPVVGSGGWAVLLCDGSDVVVAMENTAISSDSISVNTINEKTAASGVTIDGVLLKDGRALRSQSIAYAASITPDCDLGLNVVVGALTAAITVNAPSNPQTGDVLHINFLQDGTGSFGITWDSVFKKATDPTAGTANQVAATSFQYNGTNWVQQGGAFTWF